MCTQIALAALVFGIFLLGLIVFRDRYLGKPTRFTFFRLLSYILIIVPTVFFVIINYELFRDDSGYSATAFISLFSPFAVDYAWHRLVGLEIVAKKSVL